MSNVNVLKINAGDITCVGIMHQNYNTLRCESKYGHTDW